MCVKLRPVLQLKQHHNFNTYRLFQIKGSIDVYRHYFFAATTHSIFKDVKIQNGQIF